MKNVTGLKNKKLFIWNVSAWYSLFSNLPAFQENNIYTFKIHLFSFLNIKQSNQVFFRARIDKSLTWQ